MSRLLGGLMRRMDALHEAAPQFIPVATTTLIVVAWLGIWKLWTGIKAFSPLWVLGAFLLSLYLYAYDPHKKAYEYLFWIAVATCVAFGSLFVQVLLGMR